MSGGELPSLAGSAILGSVGAGSLALLFAIGYGAEFTATRQTWEWVRFAGITAALGAVSAATLVATARRDPNRSTGSDSHAG